MIINKTNTAHSLNSLTLVRENYHYSLHITKSLITCEFLPSLCCVYWYALLEFTFKLQRQHMFILT